MSFVSFNMPFVSFCRKNIEKRVIIIYIGDVGRSKQMLFCIEKMNTYISNCIIKHLETEKYGDTVKEKVKYSILVILSEIEKMTALGILFYVLGLFSEFIISYITLVSIRIFVGGNHLKTSIGCLVYTFCMYLLILKCSEHIFIGRYAKVAVILLSLICIWQNRKSLPENRINYSEKMVLKFQVKALSVLVIILVVMEFVPTGYKNVIIWTLLVENFDTIVARLKKGGKNRNHG